MSFEKWLKAKGFDPALLSEEQESILRQTYDAEQAVIAPGVDKPKPDVTQTGPVEPNHVDPKPAAGELRQAADIGDPIAQMRQQAAAELRRVEAVRKICKGDAELASKAIEQGWTPERAELEVFRLARPTAPAIHANGGGPANPRVLEAALRLGSSEPEARLVQEYGAETLEAAYPLRRIGLQGLIRACCAMDGAETPRLGAGEGELAQAGFSTASLPTILGNTANKVLLAAYRSVPSVARVIAKKLTATDFKEHTGVRLTGDSTMLKVGQDGELKFGAMNEGTFTYSVDTYGRIFGITRQMIRNDDLGAFLDIPALIGRGSGLAIEKTLFALLLANTGDFFHGDNANYISGATTALGYESLGKAIQKLLKQVDADGNPINLMGKYLVVPPELFDIAQEIFKANAINTGGAATTEKIAAANIHAGKYEPLVSPYLSAAGMTGYSTTAWYLFGDPADVPAFGIAYLDGVETPVIEDAPLQSDILGKAWRGYIDFGVCQIDHRGAVKSKGAA